MLRDAAQRGEPFLAELAVAKPLTTEVDAIAALEPFAASGVPGNAALGQQLVAIIRRGPSWRRRDCADGDHRRLLEKAS